MKRTSTIVFVLLFASFQANHAQVFYGDKAAKHYPGAEKAWVNSQNSNRHYIEFEENNTRYSKSASSSTLISLPSELQLVEKKQSTDPMGDVHTRYQVSYRGLPIEGAMVNTHSRNNKVRSINTDYPVPQRVTTRPVLTESEAQQIARNEMGAAQYRNDSLNQPTEAPQLVILPLNNTYFLCYKIDLYSIQPVNRCYVFVDAVNGTVRKTTNRLHTESSMGVAQTKYNGTQAIGTDFNGLRYTLNDQSRQTAINTLNLNTSYMFSAAVSFYDNDNHWDSNENQDDAATNAHYAFQACYDYFREKFDRNSFDNQGATITSYLHFGENYNNAFWDGYEFVFGDGDGVKRSALTSTDIVAHEYTHAITEHSAALVYEGESGALNESFSDIFGVVVDFYANPNTANYQLGEEFSLTGTASRSMADPKAFRDPDTYLGAYWISGENDNGGIHTNSGVQNHWFYLLAEGGSGTNDMNNTYQVAGIGLEKAARIAYRTLTVYLTPNAQYEDARFYSQQSAIDLYGMCSDEYVAVTNAWYAVGLGEPVMNPVNASFEVDSLYLGTLPAQIQLTNTSVNATSYQWAVNGIPFSTDTDALFETEHEGIYSITLTASGEQQCASISSVTLPVFVVNGSRLSPIISRLPHDTVVSVDEELNLALTNIFSDPGKASLYFNFFTSNSTIAQVSIQDGYLKVAPQEAGILEVELSATNTSGLSASVSFSVNITQPSALSGNLIKQISVYPNPTSDYLHINLNSFAGETVQIQLYTLSGQQVLNNRLDALPSNGQFIENISQLAPGGYQLVVSTSRKSEILQVIKQ